MNAELLLPHLPWVIGGLIVVTGLSIWGWLHMAKLKMQHGYPMEGMWGQALKPSTDGQTAQRVTLLTQENAQLQAELSAVKDRLANVERIVTDSAYQVSNEIERLRDDRATSAGVDLSRHETKGHA